MVHPSLDYKVIIMYGNENIIMASRSNFNIQYKWKAHGNKYVLFKVLLTTIGTFDINMVVAQQQLLIHLI